jgi:hypothetical protein
MSLILAALLAQASAATPAPAGGPLTISFPAQIVISAPSAANFARFNHDGFGSFIVSIKCDGSKTPLIPPTPDIDAGLKAVLLRFLDQTAVSAGKGCQGANFIVRFDVPSGAVTEVALPAPSA